jgi:iron complex outermembrane receptor protein
MFYGGKALDPEETENISLGFTLEPLENLAIALDFFRIDLENGMSVSNRIFPIAEEIAQLVALGVPNASDFAFIQYRGNEIEARIEGYDLVATYSIDWGAAGTADFSLAWNYSQEEVRFLPEEPNRDQIVAEENKMRNRGIFTINHTLSDLRFLVRASYYDAWVQADFADGPLHPVCSDDRPVPSDHDGCYGDKWIVDVEAAYTLRDRVTVALGVDNLFDERPDTHYLYPDFSFGEVYPADSPYGYNGGFWYLRLRVDF